MSPYHILLQHVSFPLPGSKVSCAVVKLQPTLHDMNRAIWMNYSFVLALELRVTVLFFGDECRTKPSYYPQSLGQSELQLTPVLKLSLLPLSHFFGCKEG